MASSSPNRYSRLSIERRPKLLKDFLDQDDPYSCNSSRMIINRPNNKPSSSSSSSSSRILLSRSRSRRAATATISAINKVINIVKFLPFVKSPSISKTLSRTENSKKHNNIDHQDHDDDDDVSVVTVKVKDILRWKSFRDLADEKSTPLDFSFSPCPCTTVTATAATTTSTNSERSSWCDSDFTAEDLPSWCGENDELEGVGGYDMRTKRATKLDHKDELCFDENEQHSPVSILESPFHEDNEEGYAFSFHRSLDDLDKRKSMLMQRIQHFESLADENTGFEEDDQDQTLVHEHDQEVQEIEVKAEQLLSHLKETNTSLFMEDYEASETLFDFFRQELNITTTTNIDIEKLMSEAKSWISGENNGEFEWDMEDKRRNYIRDMERVVSWSNFEDEKQDLIMELEFEVFNDLVHEVLDDVLFS